MHKITAVSYAHGAFHEEMSEARTPRNKKLFSSYFAWREKDIPSSFIQENNSVWRHLYKRFGGLIWKSYIVKKHLSELNEGEFLFYHDSDCEIKKDVNFLVDSAAANDGMFHLSTGLSEKIYTKRRCLKKLLCDTDDFFGEQWMTTLFLLQKNPFTVDFINEWHNRCLDIDLISDESANFKGAKELRGVFASTETEHEAFAAHRHDQSIFSLLLKLRGHKDGESQLRNDQKMTVLHPPNNIITLEAHLND